MPDKHMKIRVLEPDKSTFLKYEKKGNVYYRIKRSVKESKNIGFYYVLDIGKKKKKYQTEEEKEEKEKARGIWFIMIFPRYLEKHYKIGDPVNFNFGIPQSVRIEYKRIGLPPQEKPITEKQAKMILKAYNKSKYPAILENYLKLRFTFYERMLDKKIKGFKIISTSDGDFKLVFI